MSQAHMLKKSIVFSLLVMAATFVTTTTNARAQELSYTHSDEGENHHKRRQRKSSCARKLYWSKRRWSRTS
jgi:hypothetical protein